MAWKLANWYSLANKKEAAIKRPTIEQGDYMLYQNYLEVYLTVGGHVRIKTRSPSDPESVEIHRDDIQTLINALKECLEESEAQNEN